MSRIDDLLNRFFSKKSGTAKNNRKVMLWLAGAVALGISLIIMGGGGQAPQQADKSAEKVEIEPEQMQESSIMAREEENLASRLQGMLERIEGAGSVKVTLRLAASAKETYAVNTTTGRKTTVEKDQGGGNRTTSENTDTSQMVISRNSKGETPVVEMESASRVAGVLVVSSGAGNPQVKERLFEAVRVALGIEPHRILVLPGEGGASK